jgi:hypothetical protein
MSSIKWNKKTAFNEAATMILEVLQQDLGVTPIDPRRGTPETKKALVNILDYFTVPKNGPTGGSRVERRCYGESN